MRRLPKVFEDLEELSTNVFFTCPFVAKFFYNKCSSYNLINKISLKISRRFAKVFRDSITKFFPSPPTLLFSLSKHTNNISPACETFSFNNPAAHPPRLFSRS